MLSVEPPPMPAGLVPEVTMADFVRYLRVIGDKHSRFSQLRQESATDHRRKISVTDITPGTWLVHHNLPDAPGACRLHAQQGLGLSSSSRSQGQGAHRKHPLMGG